MQIFTNTYEYTQDICEIPGGGDPARPGGAGNKKTNMYIYIYIYISRNKSNTLKDAQIL